MWNFGGNDSTEPVMQYVFTSDMMIPLGLEVTVPVTPKFVYNFLLKLPKVI